MKRLDIVLCGLVCLSSVSLGAVRTVCGSNDMEVMANLEGNIFDMGRPIGNLRTSSGMSCTGTLVGPDLFLTARHCKAACSSTTVTFGYLSRDKETFQCKEIVEAGNSSSNQDYLFMRLEGSPGVNWGYYNISDMPVQKGQELLIIHHPGGKPMRVSRKNCSFQRETGGLGYWNCDTEPGTSGSAVMIPDYENLENTRVIAVHTFGGCNSASTSFNSGPSIRNLSTLSALVRSLVKN